MSKITGRVIDYTTDAPILGVLVQGVGSIGAPFTSTTTDGQGRYTLDSPYLDDNASKVTFTKDGYATQSMRVPSANGVDVVLPKAGTLASVTLSLKRSPQKLLLFAVIGGVLVYLAIKYKSKLKF